MRKLAMLLAVSFLIALARGCTTPSLTALWSDDTLFFDDALVGQYGDSPLEKGPDKSYLFTIKADNDKPAKKCVVHLVKLGDQLFSDMEVPVEEGTATEPAVKVWHLINRLTREGKDLKIWSFEEKSNIMDATDAKVVEVTVTQSDQPPRKNRVLSMQTRDMQAFFKAHGNQMTKVINELKRTGDLPK